MFHTVAFDLSEKASKHVRRIFSCVKLVADQSIPATMYLNSDWVKLDTIKSLGLNFDTLTPKEMNFLLERDLIPKSGIEIDAPPLVYLINDTWENTSEIDRGLPVSIPMREFVLSGSEIVNRASLAGQGINATTAVLCLAAVGLDIMLPNVAFDLMADEELESLRERFTSERVDYVAAATALAHGSYERLSQGSFNDLVRWAQNETLFVIAPKARALEESISKASKTTLRKAGYSFWREGVPAIGSGYLASGIGGASIAAAEHSLRAIVSAIGREAGRRTLPEVGYAMRIRDAQNEH